MRKNYEEISLQSDVFEAARKDFDRLLQKLFRTTVSYTHLTLPTN